MSLVESMIVVALLTVSLVSFLSLMTNQQQHSAHLTDKLASLDVERTLKGTLSGNSVCTYMVNSATPYALNPMTLSTANIPPFDEIPSRGVAGAAPVLTADGVALATPMSPRLVATSIRIQNVQCATPPCTPATTSFTGDLVVTFDTSRTGPIAPVTIPLNITTAGLPSMQMNGCSLNSGGGGGGGGGPALDLVLQESPDSCGGSPSHPNCNFVPPFVFATCPAGYRVTGCGYYASAWNPQVSGAPPPWNDYHSTAPDNVYVENNSCKMDAGGAPGCGVCFRVQAICLRVM